jgi:hypothetical protein
MAASITLSALAGLGRIDDLADAVEHEGHRAGFAQRAAGLGEGERTLEAVRLRLSVSASTMTATPPGP